MVDGRKHIKNLQDADRAVDRRQQAAAAGERPDVAHPRGNQNVLYGLKNLGLKKSILLY